MCRRFIWHGRNPRTQPCYGCKNKKEYGELGLPQWKLDIWVGGPAAACVGLAVTVSEWRGWLNLDLYQILPLWDRAFGRGTDRNSPAKKAQSNPVRHNILRRGSISLKHWESLTVVAWHLLRLLIYLNSPSVTKIPDLKKSIKEKKEI